MCRLMTNRSDLSAGMRIMNWMDERELEKVAGEGEVIGVPSSVGLFLT